MTQLVNTTLLAIRRLLRIVLDAKTFVIYFVGGAARQAGVAGLSALDWLHELLYGVACVRTFPPCCGCLGCFSFRGTHPPLCVRDTTMVAQYIATLIYSCRTPKTERR